MQARLGEGARLAEEMQVQAMAIEAARGNVEHHYAYICTHFHDFMHGCVLPSSMFPPDQACTVLERKASRLRHL